MRDRWKRESARADLAELLLRVCEELVRTPLETVDTAIVSALAAVGRAFDLDRVVTVEFSVDGAMTVLTHEWRSEELTDREPSVMELLTSALPNYNEALFARFVPVDIPDVEQLPEESGGRARILLGSRNQGELRDPLLVGRRPDRLLGVRLVSVGA